MGFYFVPTWGGCIKLIFRVIFQLLLFIKEYEINIPSRMFTKISGLFWQYFSLPQQQHRWRYRPIWSHLFSFYLAHSLTKSKLLVNKMSKSTRRQSVMLPDNVIEILDEQSDSNDSVSAPRRETRSKALKKINQLREEGGVADFNPDKSVRERKKISKIANTQGRKKNQALYNNQGIFLQTGQDLCDCLAEDCSGCFYACPKCNGSKCGGTCRRRRHWLYEHITVDGHSKSTVKTSLSELLAGLDS